ncbi:hypothetical protein O6H91_09G027800 [Diphasiastrum complanatum]|uniref:Uncharacterized protein n=1 Tax=Diphasiastrum complanatum TaxID=34168 RepID=A0ACC2CME9_DIPCM|nr:hypothetical protein O6H91_09G027800 [Diphasiastrum complanatum]
MGKSRLSSAALCRIQVQLVAQLRAYNAKLRVQELRRIQAQLVAQLRAYNEKLRIEEQAALERSRATFSSVSVDFGCCDRESDGSMAQSATTSQNCFSSATLRRFQAQIVAHLRCSNAKRGLIRAEVDRAEQPCQLLGAMATAELCSAEAIFDLESSCGSNDFVVPASSGSVKQHPEPSKSCRRTGCRTACCSSKRSYGSLDPADITTLGQPTSAGFTRLKKRMQGFKTRCLSRTNLSEFGYIDKNGTMRLQRRIVNSRHVPYQCRHLKNTKHKILFTVKL